MSALSRFAKQSIKPEVIPLLVIVGGALTGAVYIGVHAAKAPDVAWDHKENPYPWQDVKDGEQVKLMALQQKYKNRWERYRW
ncbi:hypothetical protein O0I10_006801 [Lichtheimia ornata]|uniref:Uncharacterized protein n=1 Tax=Lichtheimia ornata TaxID=688661 RepID=A0AAD7XUI4_9FUNG|nr:uncharacterized protein O0I10_006801 [Lichtheimia ornata]KAJ8657499.1 hypothetical protein O0I10_006801 [Lichtheimia ornata]